MRNMARRFGLPLAAALLTAGAVLVAACGNTNEGTPPPVADFVTDTPAPLAAGDVTLQPGASSGTMINLQVQVQEPVAGILAANFDLLFKTFRCQDNLAGQGSQNTCFTDSDCLAGESCRQSGNLVARFVFPANPGNLLDCGLPGILNPIVGLDPADTERLIIGLTRINYAACSSGLPCPNGDFDCTPNGELCGAVGKCVKPASNCVDNTDCPSDAPTCVKQTCDAGAGVNAVLLTLTFEILDRGSIRIEFADTLSATPMPPTLEDINGDPIPGVSFPAGRGGILRGL